MSLSTSETRDISRANATGLPPVVFIHGLWILASSWQPWRTLFEENGYATIAPGWPDDPATTGEARANPRAFAGKSVGQVTSHMTEAIAALRQKPAIIGHSFGGLITQQLAGQGLGTVSVAIDSAPFRGVLPLPLSALRSAMPVIGNPANYRRAVMLTYEQFRYSFANAVSENEAQRLYEAYPVPGSGIPLFQAATANINPLTEIKVDTKNRRHPDPGDPGPRPLPRLRQRLARRRRSSPGVHQDHPLKPPANCSLHQRPSTAKTAQLPRNPRPDCAGSPLPGREPPPAIRRVSRIAGTINQAQISRICATSTFMLRDCRAAHIGGSRAR
jgi:non-heme chloroperoxidase